MRLNGRVAIVTGGARGLGGAIARPFAMEGPSVMIADVDADAGRENLERIASACGQAQFTPTDVSDAAQVERLFDAAQQAFGRLDILVNNAGVVHGPAAVRHFLELPEAMWQHLIA